MKARIKTNLNKNAQKFLNRRKNKNNDNTKIQSIKHQQ